MPSKAEWGGAFSSFPLPSESFDLPWVWGWGINGGCKSWKGVQLSSVQSFSRVQLCDPMDCSTPGRPVHHQLPEFTQSRWCHPTISSSVIAFSCLQSFPASGAFLMSLLFAPQVLFSGPALPDDECLPGVKSSKWGEQVGSLGRRVIWLDCFEHILSVLAPGRPPLEFFLLRRDWPTGNPCVLVWPNGGTQATFTAWLRLCPLSFPPPPPRWDRLTSQLALN